MTATALPPVSPNPSPTPSPLQAGQQAAARGAEAGSFSRLLDAADARLQSPPVDKSPVGADTRSSTTAARPPGAVQKSPPRESVRNDRTDRAKPTEGQDGPESRDNAGKTGAQDPSSEAVTEEEAASGPTSGTSNLLVGLALLASPLAPADGSTVRGRWGPAVPGRQAADDELAAAGLGPLLGGKTGKGAALPAGAEQAGTDLAAAAGSGAAGKGFAGLLGASGAEARPEAAAALVAQSAALLPAAAATEARGADISAMGSLLQAGTAAPGSVPGHSAALPAEGRLPASPGAPGFAEQLGAQLSTFVREGVQHARLQLNPLELGPVTVQIQLNGGSAHLSFAAEHAQTRQALEQALPTLASSLREAGLTLSGGGVFEQPQQPQRDTESGAGRGQGQGGRASGDGGDTGIQTSQGPAAPRRRGVVDLVA